MTSVERRRHKPDQFRKLTERNPRSACGDPDEPGVMKHTAPMRLPLLSLDSLALIAVFLQFTQIYRPLGYIGGFTTSRQTNIVFLFFFAFYVVARNKTLVQSGSGFIAAWACALGAVPTVIMGIQLLDGSVTAERLSYWSVVSVMFALLLLVAVVLWARWGPRLSMPFFIACIGGIWVGFAVNWIDYEFVRKVMVFGSSPFAASRSVGLTLGFFGHPNEAALALVLCVASLACTEQFLSSHVLLQTVVTAFCLTGVLVTGSRTSLLLLAIALIWYTANLFKLHSSGSLAGRARALIAPLIPAIVIAAGLILLLLIASSRADVADTVGSRISSIADVVGGTDVSASMRKAILSQYYSDITASPALGRGPDYVADQMALGNYASVSQNAWLEWAVKLGVPYALLMALMLTSTYRFAARRVNSQPVSLSHARLILILFAVLSFSMVDIFWMQAPVSVLGVLLGTVLYAGTQALPRRSKL